MNISEIYSFWPELEWIADPDLREKTARVWQLAFEKSVLAPVLFLSLDQVYKYLYIVYLVFIRY